MIPGRTSRGKPIRHDKRRDRIEIMFGRLKDWRRVATCYDRCPKFFLSAVNACVDPASQLSWSGYETRTRPDPSPILRGSSDEASQVDRDRPGGVRDRGDICRTGFSFAYRRSPDSQTGHHNTGKVAS